MYNTTNLTKEVGLGNLASYANEVTGGLFVGLMVTAFFIIILVVFLRRGNQFDDSLLTSSFICFILSTILRAGNLIRTDFVWIFLLIASFTAALIAVNKLKN